MMKKLAMAVFAAVVAVATPAELLAYGAAHVGYTHVGPNGVQHVGTTAVSGPGGTAATHNTTAYGAGGGAYHSGTTAAATPYGAGATRTTTETTGGYHYAPSYSGYSGATATHTTSYGYYR